MDAMTKIAVKNLLEGSTRTLLRPAYEGANIGTIIGFKHVNFLVEQAVLDHFRAADLPVGALYEEHGLGVDVVSLDTRLQTALIVDDLVEAEVVPVTKDGATEIAFKVTFWVTRDGEEKKAVTSSVRVALRDDPRVTPREPVPAGLEPFVVDRLASTGAQPATEVGAEAAADEDALLAQLVAGRNAFAWKYRVPYFYCHFFERMQMSGFLKQMEEVVDLFLADRGLAIKGLLDDCNWIPAVTHSKIRLLGETIMEEELYTVYEVESIFKDLLYTSKMDCYVVRDGRLVHTATGTITHAYGVVENGKHGHLVNFDERVRKALRGERP
jgi:hypothetical protein